MDILVVKYTQLNNHSFKDSDGNLALFRMLQRVGGWCKPIRMGWAVFFPSRSCQSESE